MFLLVLLVLFLDDVTVDVGVGGVGVDDFVDVEVTDVGVVVEGVVGVVIGVVGFVLGWCYC